MKGRYEISIWNKRIRYDFAIQRNITIIQGDSATGKTHLIEMLQEYLENGEDSGIQMESKVKCAHVPVVDWQIYIANHSGYILFFDEDCRYVCTQEFAEIVKQSDNYFVIVTRESLGMLPYSVNEIYGIRRSGKYAGTKQVYNELYQIYGHKDYSKKAQFEEVIVEDSNSGFEFWKHYYSDKSCISAGGKSKVFDFLKTEKSQLVIADGAAFGCEMSKLIQFIEEKGNLVLFLPESFEYILLNSKLFQMTDVKEKLAKTYEYADSINFMSWERYYTALIVEITKNEIYKYSKEKLNSYFLSEKNIGIIIEGLPEIIRK